MLLHKFQLLENLFSIHTNSHVTDEVSDTSNMKTILFLKNNKDTPFKDENIQEKTFNGFHIVFPTLKTS